jgi:hypothetical protein
MQIDGDEATILGKNHPYFRVKFIWIEVPCKRCGRVNRLAVDAV